MMKHAPLKSSQIESAAYNNDRQELEIRFKSGAAYRYHQVPPQIHADLLTAESAGKFFGSRIRGKFDYTRLPAT